MKVMSGFIALALLVLAAAPVQAQDLKGNVPFPFYLADRVMPAGDYTVRIDRATNRLTMVLPGGESHAYLFAAAGYWNGGELGSALVFDRYGNDHFLRTVRSFSSYVDLPVTRKMLRVERMARNGASSEIARILVSMR